MLVLTRSHNEKVILTVPPSAEPQRIEVVVVEIRSNKVRLGFDAAVEVRIHRGEVQKEIDERGQERESA